MISAKRYALFTLDPTGRPDIVKASEHGLGHLLTPADIDNRGAKAWIEDVWRALICEALNQPVEPFLFAKAPAVSRITATSVAMLRPFDRYNAVRERQDQIRPINFLLSANVAASDLPAGIDPARFHLVARYERDASRWLRVRWINRFDPVGRTYAITTGPGGTAAVRVKCIGDVIAEYRTHAEANSLGPDRLAVRSTDGWPVAQAPRPGRSDPLHREGSQRARKCRGWVDSRLGRCRDRVPRSRSLD